MNKYVDNPEKQLEYLTKNNYKVVQLHSGVYQLVDSDENVIQDTQGCDPDDDREYAIRLFFLNVAEKNNDFDILF